MVQLPEQHRTQDEKQSTQSKKSTFKGGLPDDGFADNFPDIYHYHIFPSDPPRPT
jgi:hypothetical protein